LTYSTRESRIKLAVGLEAEIVMKLEATNSNPREIIKGYPQKLAPEDEIFKHVHRGCRVFISTGCGEPQYLVRCLVNYVESNPKALCDAEVLQVWTLGAAPYADSKLKNHFRLNSFFIAANIREAVNKGMADYTPVFLSEVPDLFYRQVIPIDVALIQTSPPDSHGFMSLGISVDIVKAAAEAASLVIVQVNSNMPRTHGDGFINIKDVDFAVLHDEPLLQYQVEAPDETALRIANYVSQLVRDGDTIQVGYGGLTNAIISNLDDKKHLGVHTDFLNDGIITLMKKGIVDNTRKTINRGKTIAAFCMGNRETYEYLDDNPSVELRSVSYTNDPLIIAQNENMTTINSAFEIDLTGQTTSESIGGRFYSGIGGQADFIRGAMLARNGRTILALPSTAKEGRVSRIVPFLREGAGVTLNRGDVHYVVTEYGIAYLHGKNIRERAMQLISIAHPKFRTWLIHAAKKRNLIYRDQEFVSGEKGRYPENLETWRTTKTSLEIFLRPVKMIDEPLLKVFFYSLSDNTLYRRFISLRKDMPHERLQKFVVIDYTEEMRILAVLKGELKDEILGVGGYYVNEAIHGAEVALVVRDDYQNKGIGTELLTYLIYLAKNQGLLYLNAEMQIDNEPMLHLFKKMDFALKKTSDEDFCTMKLMLAEK